MQIGHIDKPALVFNRKEYESWIQYKSLPFTFADLDRAEHTNGFVGESNGCDYFLSRFIATVDAKSWIGVIGAKGE